MNNTNRSKALRRAALAMAAMLAAQILVQVTAATPAGAVLAMVRTPNFRDLGGSPPAKQLRAHCPRTPSGQSYVVIGGGARITGGNGQVRLTQVEPVVEEGEVPYGYIARAEEPDTGVAQLWGLEVFAICAPRFRVPGYQLFPITRRTDESSETFQHIEAPCGGDSRVIGTGARVNHANGQVGLQLSRPDGALGIARATAREDADGYAQTWSLTAIAICADRIESADVKGTLGDQGGFFDCPDGKKVHSVGGGGGLTDSGPFFLKALWASNDLTSFNVFMTGVPTSRTAIGAICAF